MRGPVYLRSSVYRTVQHKENFEYSIYPKHRTICCFGALLVLVVQGAVHTAASVPGLPATCAPCESLIAICTTTRILFSSRLWYCRNVSV